MQVRAHAVSPALQRNGAQDSAVPGTHAPIPSQRDSVSVFAVGSQLAALHSWPSAYSWQAPLPSQNPVCLQVETSSFAHGARFAGAGWPAAIVTQRPGVATVSHCWQLPVQALSQQRPSTQWFDAHWPSAPHESPIAFGWNVSGAPPSSFPLPGTSARTSTTSALASGARSSG